MNQSASSSLFKNKSYVFLISAQVISNIGDWLHILALLTLVGLKWHASPLAMTGTMLCLTVPAVLFGPIAGVVVDRIDRKHMMIVSDICRAFIVLGIAFSSHLWQVYVLLCLLALFSDLFNPAESAKIKEIVSEEHLQQAVAYSGVINNGAKIIGPMISGIVVSLMGIKGAFYLDALSFILSALLLIGLPKTPKVILEERKTQNHQQKKSFFKDLIDGLSFIKQSPILFLGLLILSFVFFALQISDSQSIVLFREIPHLPVHLIGTCMAASGAGMLISSLILSKINLGSRLITLAISPIIVGGGLFSAGWFVHLPLSIINILYPIIFIFVGLAMGMAIIPFQVLTQKLTPSSYTGRIFGTINSVSTLFTILGMLTGGLLSEWMGGIRTFLASGTLLIIIGLLVTIFYRVIERRDKIGTKSVEGTHQSAKG
ncbi:MFS transporter [Terrilactibacillus laevilacticus]|uniref:MFS transporter n=1 Tax=Terrilactibacillus laevilacticus TaxID=1380157 RepID=UPI0011474B5F|nr:MFS transporter [Terrilactibacillus laevilacticus]